MNSFIKNIEVSFSMLLARTKDGIARTKPDGIAPIHKLIMSQKYKDVIMQMRSMPVNTDQEIKAQKAMKASRLPVFMPGIFKNGLTNNDISDKALIIVVDADGDDNPGLTVDEMFSKLSPLPYVAAIATSVRGKGVYAVIRINPTNSNDDYHKIAISLEKDLQQVGINIDPACKNIARLRFFGYTDKAWFNPDEPVIYEAKTSNKKTVEYPSTETHITFKKVEDLVKEIERKGLDIAPDYNEYLSIAFSFANEYKENGRCYFHRVCSQSSRYSFQDAEKKYNNALTSSSGKHSIKTFYHYCKIARLKTIDYETINKSILATIAPIGIPTLRRNVYKVSTLKQPPTAEEIAYSKLIIINPLIRELVDRAGLVSATTGQKIWPVDIGDYKPPKLTDREPLQLSDGAKILSIAKQLMEGENNYTRQEIVTKIQEAAGISLQRAEKAFKLYYLIQAMS